jgi:enoyl-CoA hydratase/carnithine racemase
MPKVIYEKRDRVAYVTLNRPEAKNAIDPETDELLWQTWRDFRDDDSLDVAIVTGTGDAFCAGADLKTFIPPRIAALTARSVRDNVATGLGGLTRGLHRIYKPVIAAVNGWALAGGFETALACDIRIASERAMFGSFEARRGFHHGDGGLVRLVNAGGVSVAMQMLLTAEPIDARQALEWNLVSKVVPHDELIEEAETVARQILRNSQRAVRSAKQTILDVIGQPLDMQLRTEAWNAYTCADAEETRAMLEAFYEKRDPGRAGSHETSL